jgi:hypothetical protein
MAPVFGWLIEIRCGPQLDFYHILFWLLAVSVLINILIKGQGTC